MELSRCFLSRALLGRSAHLMVCCQDHLLRNSSFVLGFNWWVNLPGHIRSVAELLGFDIVFSALGASLVPHGPGDISPRMALGASCCPSTLVLKPRAGWLCF